MFGNPSGLPGKSVCDAGGGHKSLSSTKKTLVLDTVQLKRVPIAEEKKKRDRWSRDLTQRAGFSSPASYKLQQRAQSSRSQGVHLLRNTPGSKAPLTGPQTLGPSDHRIWHSRGFQEQHRLSGLCTELSLTALSGHHSYPLLGQPETMKKLAWGNTVNKGTTYLWDLMTYSYNRRKTRLYVERTRTESGSCLTKANPLCDLREVDT
ncbi:uncharacterized protein LOC102410881 isoform X1 [Bubalus bubalis]|uniref:uncharacterized protein LOC102410881 isoform X1 n=1 Tax=Bubalus bubalis TaxID=89462 RepID=UPI001D118DC8|nr:uncharacterized protein LOC102410881 isoform X1 [Bubalus bubalis]